MKKEERSQINNLTFYLKTLKKDQSKVSSGKKTVKITAEINEIKNKNTGKSMNPKADYLKKSAKLIKLYLVSQRKKERSQIIEPKMKEETLLLTLQQ